MHEMSLATSLLSIIRQEMEKHGAARLIRVHVRHGAMANVVPEALDMAFEVQIADTELEGAALELVEEPVKLRCGSCGLAFMPEPGPALRFSACPACGEELGHSVLAGKELYIDHIEVE